MKVAIKAVYWVEPMVNLKAGKLGAMKAGLWVE
jgi:hypothetical protein